MADEEVFQLRKKCLEGIDKLKSEIGAEKKLRDTANSEVKKAKEARDNLTKDLSAAQKDLNEALKNTGDLKNFDRHAYGRLKSEYDDLNWSYQTGAVSMKKEKEIVKELDALEAKLKGFEAHRKKEKDTRKLKKKVAILRNKALELHKIVLGYADESEKHHQEMRKLDETLKKLYEEKNGYDEKVSDIKKEDQKAKDDIREFEENKLKTLKSKMVSKAKDILAKFKGGEKITADELKILQETDTM